MDTTAESSKPSELLSEEDLQKMSYQELKEIAWQNSVQEVEELTVKVASLRKSVPAEIKRLQEEFYSERFETICAPDNLDSDTELSSPEKLNALAPKVKADELSRVTDEMKERFENIRKLRAKNKRMEEELAAVENLKANWITPA